MKSIQTSFSIYIIIMRVEMLGAKSQHIKVYKENDILVCSDRIVCSFHCFRATFGLEKMS